MKIILVVFSVLLLIYLIIPGPTSIRDFVPLPNSQKSTLEGDTIQIPDVAAYFSNNYRKFVTNFYKQNYQQKTLLPLGPIRLNYPPEFAFTAIKDQTQSTYLEEYLYPLRDSLYVNGLEPLYPDGQPRYWGAIKFEIGQYRFDTKATLRYYPSTIWARLIVWAGINVSIIFIWKLGKKVIFNV